jgi:hypothetical protein
MTELKEVFEMTTKQVEPDLDSWKDQERRQEQTRRRRRIGAFAVAAAIGVAAVVLVLAMRSGDDATTPATAPPTVNPRDAEAGAVGTVTTDGSTCSMEITADRIEPGVVLFEAINTTDQRVMFDSWQLLEGYTFRAFETYIERSRRSAENGQLELGFPEASQVTYLTSDVIPPNSSGTFVATMSSGRHAITCLQPYEVNPGRSRMLPFGIVGPFDVR